VRAVEFAVSFVPSDVKLPHALDAQVPTYNRVSSNESFLLLLVVGVCPGVDLRLTALIARGREGAPLVVGKVLVKRANDDDAGPTRILALRPGALHAF